ncbi:hypothetical protein HJC23_013215 [Cyclotella cryptica]|uniref:Uncharacterized protein n=1 Tax=Cyclotella cryptica TaxID=29204 RepID=A0ABD3QD14_9STRA
MTCQRPQEACYEMEDVVKIDLHYAWISSLFVFVRARRRQGETSLRAAVIANWSRWNYAAYHGALLRLVLYFWVLNLAVVVDLTICVVQRVDWRRAREILAEK